MKKASKIFFTASIIYLLFPFLLLLSQPISGYPAEIESILFKILMYIPLFLLIWWLSKIIKRNETLKNKLLNPRLLYYLLILSVLVGFVFNLDYQRQYGCFIENESFFSPVKIRVAIISLCLLTAGKISKNKTLNLLVLIIEFFFWTGKVLYYNSSLDLILPGYFTIICWFLRMGLINQVLIKNTN